MQASARDQAGGGTEPGASAAAERKRRGDMEFENQLAMALQVLIAHPEVLLPVLPDSSSWAEQCCRLLTLFWL